MIIVMKEWIRNFKDNCLLRIHIQPGASENKLFALYGQPVRLKIKVKSSPVEGRANKALIEYLSDILSVPKKDIEIVRGHTSRSKDVVIKLDFEDAAQSIEEKLIIILDKNR